MFSIGAHVHVPYYVKYIVDFESKPRRESTLPYGVSSLGFFLNYRQPSEEFGQNYLA